jgi:hypothetical protein
MAISSMRRRAGCGSWSERHVSQVPRRSAVSGLALCYFVVFGTGLQWADMMDEDVNDDII